MQQHNCLLSISFQLTLYRFIQIWIIYKLIFLHVFLYNINKNLAKLIILIFKPRVGNLQVKQKKSSFIFSNLSSFWYLYDQTCVLGSEHQTPTNMKKTQDIQFQTTADKIEHLVLHFWLGTSQNNYIVRFAVTFLMMGLDHKFNSLCPFVLLESTE